MNAETRAKELATELVEASGLRPGAVGWLWDDRAQSAIAQALRQAENDKLEEAAVRVESIAMMEHEAGGPANDDLMSLCVNQIRESKSKDTP